MNNLWLRLLSVALVTVCLCSLISQAASVGEGSDMGYSFDDLTQDDVDAAILAAIQQEMLEKRGGRCKPGFVWHTILRKCFPSVGALKSRMKGMRRRPQ